MHSAAHYFGYSRSARSHQPRGQEAGPELLTGLALLLEVSQVLCWQGHGYCWQHSGLQAGVAMCSGRSIAGPRQLLLPLWLQCGCYYHHRNNKDNFFFFPVGVSWPPLESATPALVSLGCVDVLLCVGGRTWGKRGGGPPKPDLEGSVQPGKAHGLRPFLWARCLGEQGGVPPSLAPQAATTTLF